MSIALLRIHVVSQRLRDAFTPELRRRVAVFTVASLGVGLLAILVLQLIDATYEPLAWTILACIGAAYGWFGRSQLAVIGPVYDDDYLDAMYIAEGEEE